MIVDTNARHETLVAALMDPRRWPVAAGAARRIDTHISTILLIGDLAFKIKKPLDLGFLNFVSLEARHQACLEELRLNRRTAPDIYLGVSALTGSLEDPEIDGAGTVVDWMVRMRRFDADATLRDNPQGINHQPMRQLGREVAALHAGAAVAGARCDVGSAEQILLPMRDNFAQLRRLAPQHLGLIEWLSAWTDAEHARCRGLLDQRKATGRVRECHGDLHLGNVVAIDGRYVPFDAIEFAAELRWIDTISDVAFLTMDLHRCGRQDLVWVFLDSYLQTTGDYAGLGVLRLYAVYRAMVRAKIAAIDFAQSANRVDRDVSAVGSEVAAYLELGAALCESQEAAIIITMGPSGSGKSHFAAQLPGAVRGVCLRSDLERKRLLGMAPTADATALGGYAVDQTNRTYGRLLESAECLVRAGYSAIVDATFLLAERRRVFRDLAARLGVPCVILACEAPAALLRQRIERRRLGGFDPSDADARVLARQLDVIEPLDDDELRRALRLGPEAGLCVDRLERLIRLERDRLRAGTAPQGGDLR